MGIIPGMDNLPDSGECFQVGGQPDDSVVNTVEGPGPTATLGPDRTTRMMEVILQQQQDFMASFMQQQHAMMANFLEALGNNQQQNAAGPASVYMDNITTEPVVASPSRPVSTSSPQTINSDHEWKQIALTLSSNVSKTPPVERPSFRNLFKTNPIMFLDKFERYFKSLKCNPNDKLDVVLGCLEYPASQWVELKQISWKTFDDFKQDFLNHYWSESKQQQIRSEILLTKFEANRSSMSEHFIRQINNARTLTIPLPELVMIADVMRQFPVNIQSLWSVYPQRDVAGALEFLNRQENCIVKRNKMIEYADNHETEKRKTPYSYGFSKHVNVLQNVRVPPPNIAESTSGTSVCCANCKCHQTNSENFSGTN